MNEVLGLKCVFFRPKSNLTIGGGNMDEPAGDESGAEPPGDGSDLEQNDDGIDNQSGTRLMKVQMAKIKLVIRAPLTVKLLVTMILSEVW